MHRSVNGAAIDGHKRIVDSIRRMAGDKVAVEERNKSQGANGPVRISGPELDFALEIVDDHGAYLAVSLSRNAKASEHRKVLDQVASSATIPNGYNPPWVKDALAAIPPNAYGFFLGEIPAQWRKYLIEALGLRVCPRSFVCHLKREGQGVALSLTLNLDKAGTDRLLRDDLEKWRRQGIDSIQAKWPAVRKEPQALASLGQTLKTMQWQADRGGVRTQVHVSATTWTALCAVLKRASE